MIALFIGLALAADPLVRPAMPEPGKTECAQAIPLRAGRPPPAELVGPDGLVRCDAIAEPVTRLAYLIAVERHRNAIEEIHAVDVRILEGERDWYKAAHLQLADPPWYDRAVTHRWAGRLETLITVSVIVAGGAAVYNWTEG